MQYLEFSESQLADSHAAQLRVLQLLPDLSLGPTSRHALSIAQAIAQAGGHMAVASAGGRMEPQFRRAGTQHITHEIRAGLFSNKSTLGLLEELHRANIAILHVHQLEDGLAAKALAEAANIPLVMTCHDLPDSSHFFARRSTRKHLAGRPLMTVSKYLASRLIDDYGLPAEIVHPIPTGLDIADFNEEGVTTQRTIALADKWGIVEDPRAVALIPCANTDSGWLKSILSTIADPDMPDMIWVLVAEGTGVAPEISDLLVRGGIADRIRWVEHVDDWPAAYKLASVVVDLPATPRAHASAALQAQAMGRPVILNDIGAASEAMLPERTGWLLPAKEPGALVAAMQMVTARDELQRAALAMMARNFIATEHSVAAMQQAVLMHYTTALSATP